MSPTRRQALERIRTARLYAITPEAAPERIVSLVTAWLRGGVDVVQLRLKRLPRGQLVRLADRLAPACAAAGVPFIVDDQVDVALLSGATGVHVGPDDLSVAAVRRVSGDLVVGASAATPEEAREAVRQGADYLGSGPAYATPIKTRKPVIGPAGVAAVAAAVTVPVFAIGGIERSRLAELQSAGVGRVCAIRALSEAADPEAEVRAWRRALYGSPLR
ncbi:MAG TPA: thiamine phosphate synthase [Candidatus Dormibacteraeota bacterium]|nr:thiamine phosphate synthase [Candidatus Dormibacteraeota bacterium]